MKKLITKPEKITNSISIGNITTGGTGKTPITLLIAEHFKERSTIVTKGYGGVFKGHIKDRNIEGTSSDETILYAKNMKYPDIIVAWNRIDHIKREQGNERVYIFDDAMQYFRLKPSVSICLLDGNCPVGNGFLIPAGILREPFYSVKKADIVLIKRGKSSDHLKRKVSKYLSEIFEFYYESCGIYDKNDKIISDSKDYFAVSSICNPGSFKDILLKLNITTVDLMVFPDHYNYTEQDIEKIKKQSKDHPIITTEKDFVKLISFDMKDLFYLKIKPVIIEKERFFTELEKKIADNNN